MKKAIGIVLLVVAAACGGWYYVTGGTMRMDEARKAAMDAVVGSAKPEDVAALALKTIELKQGENGIEIWRLKADWGNMKRSGNTMELEKPRFTYYMPPDNEEVTITSSKGEIEQETQVIRFIDDVLSTFDNRTIASSRMIYEGAARVVTFPEGATLTGADIAGKAAHVVWRLNDRAIDATGGVDVTFFSERDLLPAPPRPEQQPSAARPGM